MGIYGVRADFSRSEFQAIAIRGLEESLQTGYRSG